jgi:sugar phosphate isomerase/epimerase
MDDFGIVSNCWRAELDAGGSLDELLVEAERRGYRHIELRQGSLGACETTGKGGPHPDAGALRQLPARFPGLRFNLALALPYLGGTITPETALFEAGLRGAVALGGAGAAHLRLVDTETSAGEVTATRETLIAERLAVLAATCAERGATLSVENARQPWEALRRIFLRARERLGSGAGALSLCYDPCNLLSAADRPDARVETARLRADEIALFHLKQSHSGTPLPVVGHGEVDWPAQWGALQQMGYTGPRLFEIPAGPEIWERLERSREYLCELTPRSGAS